VECAVCKDDFEPVVVYTEMPCGKQHHKRNLQHHNPCGNQHHNCKLLTLLTMLTLLTLLILLTLLCLLTRLTLPFCSPRPCVPCRLPVALVGEAQHLPCLPVTPL
jgi:hypothetical protein